MALMEMLKMLLNGPGQVIRSTVSLCFVLQIDEGLYSAVVPESRKQILESMQFGVEEPQRAGNGPGDGEKDKIVRTRGGFSLPGLRCIATVWYMVLTSGSVLLGLHLAGLIVSYLLYFHIYVLIFGSLIIVISMRSDSPRRLTLQHTCA